MCSFCSDEMSDRLASSAIVSSSRWVSIISLMRTTWSYVAEVGPRVRWNEIVFEARAGCRRRPAARRRASGGAGRASRRRSARCRGATRAVVGEDLFFDGLEIILELRDDREVVDDEVHQRVEHVSRPFDEELGRRLASGAKAHVRLQSRGGPRRRSGDR